jgi:hypothetical protein
MEKSLLGFKQWRCMNCLKPIALLLLITSQMSFAAPKVVLRDVEEIKFPSQTDSNSPAHWDGDTFFIFNSIGRAFRSEGKDPFHLANTHRIKYDETVQVAGGQWIEATWKAPDGSLYGWYHNEPPGLCPGSEKKFQYGLTAPRIGAMRSKDNGETWTDLGMVLEAPEGTLDCASMNGYFAGGNGDFSVMLDAREEYLYFFFGTYAGDLAQQGISIARMAFRDRDQPAGKVWKFYHGDWKEPGIGGHVEPVFPAMISWKVEDADAFWGPSIHWNTHLGCYVILMNRTRYKPGWPQEGIYISYSTDLSNPKSWTPPERILEGGKWYPEVLGVNSAARETDKVCGQQGRLYMMGASRLEILFLKEGEEESGLPAVFEPEVNPR